MCQSPAPSATPCTRSWPHTGHPAGHPTAPLGAATPHIATPPPLADVIAAAAIAVSPAGSRRRRLWELDSHAFCPVIGVCLPLDAVRALVQREQGADAPTDDYALHCEAIAASKQRTPLAERIHDALDDRYAPALRAVRQHKTTAALALWWRHALTGDGVAGALWATLTHPRCDTLLEEQVLHDIHLLQHQWGAAERADRRRLRELQASHERLQQNLAAQQARHTELIRQQSLRMEQLQARLVRLQGDLLGRDTRIAQLQDELQQARQAAPDLAPRRELQAQVQGLRERLVGLDRALRQARLAAAARPAQAGSPTPTPAPAAAVAPTAPAVTAPALSQRAVLCVGGRSRAVPVYRHVIETEGARFLHHDGGTEQGAAQLDASLAAADLVICQTGCISHDAYWRVKSHCKRTGKPCVFVEQPSRSGLQRALGLDPGRRAAPQAAAASQTQNETETATPQTPEIPA